MNHKIASELVDMAESLVVGATYVDETGEEVSSKEIARFLENELDWAEIHQNWGFKYLVAVEKYLSQRFGLSPREAKKAISEWMK